MSKIIYFTSFKGGTGVTSCCLGIGRALAEQGERTLVVDGDFRCGSGIITAGCRDLQVYTLADYEKGGCRAKQTIIAHPAVSNLHLMPSLNLKNPAFAAHAVEDVEGLFDYILLDKTAYEKCGSAIIVTDPSPSSVKSADVCRSALFDGGIKELGLIVNKLSASQILNGDSMTAREIAAILKIKLFAVIPEDLFMPSEKRKSATLRAFKIAADNLTGKTDAVANVLKGYGGLHGYIKRKMREKI